MVDKVLKFILLLIPVSYCVNIPLQIFDIHAFYIISGVLLAASLFDIKRREISKELKILTAGLLGIGVLSCALSGFNQYVLSSMTSLFLAVMSFLVIYSCVSDPRKLYKFMIYSALINITVLFFQRIGFHPILNEGLTRGQEGGIMGNSTRLAAYLSIVLPFTTGPLFILFIIAAIMVKENTIILIAAVILIMRKRYYLAPVFVFMALLASEKILVSFNTRLTIWLPTIKQIFKGPVSGYGLGIYPRISEQFSPTRFPIDFSFNSYLQFIFETGLAGVIWLGYALKGFFKNLETDIESQAVVSILILSLLEYPFQITRLWIALISIIAFYYIKKEAACL